MADAVQSLAAGVAAAVSTAVGRALPAHVGEDPIIRPSDHADFQSNVALALAKKAKSGPRDVATAILTELDTADLLEPPVLSGPGFLNLTLSTPAVWSQVAVRSSTPRFGIGEPLRGRRVVIDYSSPNIAKEMHVGHLRSMIIGDALARIVGYLGAKVIRQNHLGDWGTQFGMLIQYIDEHPEAHWHHSELKDGASEAISVLDSLYRAARKAFDSDAAFADRARARVVLLQSGDPDTLKVWRGLVAESEVAFQAIYDRMGVLLTPGDNAGESSYNPYLADVVNELTEAGIAVESQGALCVFIDGVIGPDGEPVPLIVRKSDGGYGYAATDLATIRHRTNDLKADQLLYVVDARQGQHFQMIFATARRAGWLTDNVAAEHVAFGTVLGADGKPFKTRSGETVRLVDLIDQAVDQARIVVAEKDNDLDSSALETVAEAAGIGAVKYADLSGARWKDYVFNVDRMVSFSGNTGVYLQYAHARIRSILAKLPVDEVANAAVTVDLPLHDAERALALLLDRFGEVVEVAGDSLEPHRIGGYLFSLAKAFSEFYEECPVVSASDAAVRGNRLVLCGLAGDVLAEGLRLLGIAAPDRI